MSIRISKWFSLASILCLTLASSAQADDAVRTLKLLPAPKEVRMADGKLVIKPSTTILISNPEDRTVAEMLQKEIFDRSGVKLSIESVTAAPKTTGHISLGRLTDRGLRSYLESQGVKMGDELGNQGYVIRATDSGVLVAGSSAQGLFLRRANPSPVAAPGQHRGKDARRSSPRHPRLAQHGMARRER